MMRRLEADELARSPTQSIAVHTAHERARAAAVVDRLRPYLHEELALQSDQIDELALMLERALLLAPRDNS